LFNTHVARNEDMAMETPIDFEDLAVVTDSDLVGYYHPRAIVADPELSPSRKRELLAHWASDIHAVRGAPALRCVYGATASIDDIFAAFRQLDDLIDSGAMQSGQRVTPLVR
jgi:hypothetical protein